MNLLSLVKVSLSLGNNLLLNEATFCLQEGSRLALVGANGSGKSTLMRIMAGVFQPDSGHVAVNKNLRIGYIEQLLPKEQQSLTVRECVVAPWRNSYEVDPYDYRVSQLLDQMKFSSERAEQVVQTLSGGEINRILLARALIVEPTLLLLDEPTNHLDLPGIAQFEEMLNALSDISLCIISHDRALLDRCTNETLFLRDGELKHFNLPYSKARQALAGADEALTRLRQAQNKEIKRLEESARQLKHWAATFGNEKFAYRARSIEKRIEKKEAQAVVLPSPVTDELKLGSQKVEAKYLVRFENAVVALGDSGRTLKVPDLRIQREERVAIVGVNGAGKSSLLKALVRATQSSSVETTIAVNPQVTIGYYDQLLEFTYLQQSVIKYAQNMVTSLSEMRLSKELLKAGFDPDKQNRIVELLSGGERARLKLLAIHLARPSLYILDEPTNHLDINGIEQLEKELTEGRVTTLFVSHDREFVDRIATKIFLVEDGSVHLLEKS